MRALFPSVGSAGVLFQRKIEFDDSIDLSIPTLVASLPASTEGTSYPLRIKSFLGSEGGGDLRNLHFRRCPSACVAPLRQRSRGLQRLRGAAQERASCSVKPDPRSEDDGGLPTKKLAIAATIPRLASSYSSAR